MSFPGCSDLQKELGFSSPGPIWQHCRQADMHASVERLSFSPPILPLVLGDGEPLVIHNPFSFSPTSLSHLSRRPFSPKILRDCAAGLLTLPAYSPTTVESATSAVYHRVCLSLSLWLRNAIKQSGKKEKKKLGFALQSRAAANNNRGGEGSGCQIRGILKSRPLSQKERKEKKGFLKM